jgi:hypothetical protein
MKTSLKVYLKGLLFFLFLIAIAIIFSGKPIHPVLLGTAIMIAAVFMLHLILRRLVSMKSYYTSEMNFLSTGERFIVKSDIPADILIDKLAEVAEQAGFSVLEKDREEGLIFAITRTTFVSWGENIYITVRSLGSNSEFEFNSVCFFQLYDWGKNERNYHQFMTEFEKSLII